jgi:phosphatidylglycerophosphatase A
MTAATDSGVAPTPRKPRFSYFIATVCGLGYLKPGPGTWGSLAGVAIYSYFARTHEPDIGPIYSTRIYPGYALVLAIALVAFVGVWTAHRVARYTAKKDPQFIVIDETSGQMLAYGLAMASFNWKYLLVGFILFRVFDIWKPFPVRQAESLPGGWGIMADDWVAALYAAAGLWVARWLGL